MLVGLLPLCGFGSRSVCWRVLGLRLLKLFYIILQPAWTQTSPFQAQSAMGLAAQCKIALPPISRKTPFRDSIAEGGIAPICLVFIGYRASIAEIQRGGKRTHLPCFHSVSRKYRWDTPFEGGGVSHLHFACSPRGKRSEKGEGVSHPIGHVETPKTP